MSVNICTFLIWLTLPFWNMITFMWCKMVEIGLDVKLNFNHLDGFKFIWISGTVFWSLLLEVSVKKKAY